MVSYSLDNNNKMGTTVKCILVRLLYSVSAVTSKINYKKFFFDDLKAEIFPNLSSLCAANLNIFLLYSYFFSTFFKEHVSGFFGCLEKWYRNFEIVSTFCGFEHMAKPWFSKLHSQLQKVMLMIFEV